MRNRKPLSDKTQSPRRSLRDLSLQQINEELVEDRHERGIDFAREVLPETVGGHDPLVEQRLHAVERCEREVLRQALHDVHGRHPSNGHGVGPLADMGVHRVDLGELRHEAALP
eukprot:11222149-Alexandrium_andersonii.AAC.2